MRCGNYLDCTKHCVFQTISNIVLAVMSDDLAVFALTSRPPKSILSISRISEYAYTPRLNQGLSCSTDCNSIIYWPSKVLSSIPALSLQPILSLMIAS